MKRILFALVITLLATVASAQTPAQAPNIFETMEQCRAAYFSGNYRVYEPKFFGLNATNPVNGGSRIAAPLEHDACVKLKTTAGMKPVVQREGTMYRWETDGAGNLKIYARNDCGNPAEEISYLIPPPAPSPVVAPVVAPAPAAPLAQAIAITDNGRCSICPETPAEVVMDVPRRRVWPWVVGALAVGAIAYVASQGSDDPTEKVTTLPPCTSLPCN